jgi:hypothetical protein
MNGGSCCFYELTVGRRGRQNFACKGSGVLVSSSPQKKPVNPGNFIRFLHPLKTVCLVTL